jgi:hypothetical protein
MTTTPATAVQTASATFVEQLYAQFLNRSAGAAEVTYWAGKIADGTLNAAEVSASFLASAEFQQAVDPVVRLYFTAFGRIPDAAGVHYWSGVASDVTAQEMGAAFARGDEFQQLYGKVSDEAFLDTLYQNAFKRAPDAAGKDYFLDQLAKGESRSDIVVAFSHSDEMTSAMGATVKVVEQYMGVHGVAPTAAQVAAALATVDPVALLTKLYASDAYTGADVPFLSRAGVVADGYIKGATVTMTIKETINGVETTRTVSTVTDANGHFDFGDKAGFGDMVQTGGTDIATGATVNGSYHAVAGSTVINPLTTLVAGIAADGKVDAAAAEAMVKARLGIDESVDLGSYDPISVLNSTDSKAADQAVALQVQAVLAQVNTVMGQAGAVLAGTGIAGGADGGASSAAAALAHMIENAGAGLDLASAATTAQLLKESAALSGATSTQQEAIDALASAAGTAVANLNKAIADAAGAAGGTALSHLIALAQVQTAAEAIEAMMANGARAGSVSDSVNATTGAALATAIANAAAHIGDVNGDGHGDGPTIPTPGSGSGSGSAPATFKTIIDADTGALSFSGTARGDITLLFGADQLAFVRGGIQAPMDEMFSAIALGAGQKLALTSSQCEVFLQAGIDIGGAGSVALTVDQSDVYMGWGSIGTASFTVAVTDDVTLREDASLGSAAVTVATGATLTAQASMLDGAHVSGAGNVMITDIEGSDADLSHVAPGVNVIASLGQEADVREQTNLDLVDQFELGGLVRMTAAQADGATLTAPGEAFAIISGSDGSQRIDVSQLSGSIVEGGGGADQITLGAQADTIQLGFGRAPAYQQQTLTLDGAYEAGDIISGYLNENYYNYTVSADDLAQGGNPLAAIAAKVALALEGADTDNAVTASADANGIVTLTANALNQPFDLDAGASNRQMVWQLDRITLSGSYEAGDTINVTSTVFGNVSYTVTESDLTDNAAAGTPGQALANITSSLLTALRAGDNGYDAYEPGADGVIMIAADSANIVTASTDNGAPLAAQAQQSIVNLSGTWEEGDSVSVYVNDFEVGITVLAADLAGDVLANMAAKVALELNSEFDGLLTATADPSGQVTLHADTAGTGFSVDADTVNRAGQNQQDTITLSGTYEAGDIISIDVNGSPHTYTVLGQDLTGNANANIAAKVATALMDPMQMLYNATASGPVVTLTGGVTFPAALTVSASAVNGAGGADTQVLTHANPVAFIAPGAASEVVSVTTPVLNRTEQGADTTQSAVHGTVAEYAGEGQDNSQAVDTAVTVPLLPAPQSNLAAMDVITGFQAGVDTIELRTGSGLPANIYSLERLANVASSSNLADALATAFDGEVAAEAAAILVIETGSAAGTYLYVNDDDAAYSATNDVFIKLVGVVGLADVGLINTGDFFGGNIA